MATLIKPGQKPETHTPRNGKKYTLAEVQAIVDGYIEPIRLKGGRTMYVNEDALNMPGKFAINPEATRIVDSEAPQYLVDEIIGNALIVEKGEF